MQYLVKYVMVAVVIDAMMFGVVEKNGGVAERLAGGGIQLWPVVSWTLKFLVAFNSPRVRIAI